MRKIIFSLLLCILLAQLLHSQSPKVIKVGILNSKALNIPKPRSNGLALHHVKIEKPLIIRIQVVVNSASGKVVSAKVIKGHPLLIRGFINSAKRTRFRRTPNINSAFVKGTLVYILNPDKTIETDVSDKIILGEAIKLPKPIFPFCDCKFGEISDVITEVQIDETGKVASAKAISGHPILRNKSVQVAKRASFTPTYKDGKAVKSKAIVVYRFLTKKEQTEAYVKSIEANDTVIINHFPPQTSLTNSIRRNIKVTGNFNSNIIKLVRPTYSKAAILANVKGKVIVDILVDEKGNVEEAKAISGHPLLRKQSEIAARKSKFRITKLSGKAVKVRRVIVYYFN